MMKSFFLSRLDINNIPSDLVSTKYISIKQKWDQLTFYHIDLVKEKNTNIKRFMKVWDIGNLSHFKNEIMILKQIGDKCKQVKKVVDIFYDSSLNKFITVFEYEKGEELLYDSIKNKKLKTKEIKKIGLQLFSIINFFHSHNIILKSFIPETIMFNSTKKSIKLFDFCHAFNITNQTASKNLNYLLVNFLAPEIVDQISINCRWSKSSDYFSFGCVLYNMMTNELPFFDDGIKKNYQNILDCKFTFPKSFNDKNFEQLMSILLVPEEQRASNESLILSHPWFN